MAHYKRGYPRRVVGMGSQGRLGNSAKNDDGCRSAAKRRADTVLMQLHDWHMWPNVLVDVDYSWDEWSDDDFDDG